MKDKDYVRIFDTTLRDGEQAAHATLYPHEKLEIAKMLAKLGVDCIEAGFPVSSDGDFKAVSMIAKQVKGPYIAGLARAVKGDIDRAYEAVRYSSKPLIHVFIASSPIHMQTKLKKTPKQTLRMAVEGVRYARSLLGSKGQVEFSAEDATRSEPGFLCQMIRSAIDAGADIINIPDTVGYSAPEEFASLIRYIREDIAGIDSIILSVHCHNDLGNADANSLAAVINGARQVECTINGLGERAGNAALESVVMNLATRKDYYGKKTGVHTKLIYPTSRLVEKYTGIIVPINKPIVGDNAFKHSSGIHQDGVCKNRINYEIMDPADIGVPSQVNQRIPIGPRTGKKGLVTNAERLGYQLSEEELEKTYEIAMQVADAKKNVSDDDLVHIIEDEVRKVPETYRLVKFHSASDLDGSCTASVVLEHDGKLMRYAAIGDGPVDAAGKAIEHITGMKLKFEDFKLRSIGSGKDAMGEVTLRVKDNGSIIIAKGVSTNIDIASVNAYVNAVNKIAYKNGHH